MGRVGPVRSGPRPLTIPAIADADGLAGVSMQRMAEALGVTKMVLYRYVSIKWLLRASGALLATSALDWRHLLDDQRLPVRI